MKTYEEMAQNALIRIGQYKAEQKKRRKAVTRIAAPATSFCLVAIIGLGAWHAGVFQKTPMISDQGESGIPIPNPDGTIQREEMPENVPNPNGTIEREPMPEVFPEHPILHPGDEDYIAPIPTLNPEAPVSGEADAPSHTADAPAVPDETKAEPAIITGDDGQKGGGPEVTEGSALFWWKNKLVMTGNLYWAIDENPGAAFSVLATYRPATANVTDFTYEGKTLAEWAVAADNERILPEKMAQLLKCGDELKYGTALYETGTPDGIKWDQSWYENQVAYFGDLLDKYIVDGEFFREALEADIAALQSISVTTPDGATTVTYIGETAARKQYALAWQAYLETVLSAAVSRLKENGISCERASYRNDALTLLATAQQMENLPLEDLESWYFDLASDDLKGTAEIVTETAGLQIVN